MIKFVFQDKPLGTGDAVLKTRKLIKDKHFLMLLPDDLIIKKNCSKAMIRINKKFKSSVMASMKVNKKTVSRWGIYKIKNKINKNDFTIKGVVEKPSINKAPSNNAVIGRYILPKKIFSKLTKLKPGKGNEIHITDAIQELINDNEKFIGHNFLGKYLDFPNKNAVFYLSRSRIVFNGRATSGVSGLSKFRLCYLKVASRILPSVQHDCILSC